MFNFLIDILFTSISYYKMLDSPREVLTSTSGPEEQGYIYIYKYLLI